VRIIFLKTKVKKMFKKGEMKPFSVVMIVLVMLGLAYWATSAGILNLGASGANNPNAPGAGTSTSSAVSCQGSNPSYTDIHRDNLNGVIVYSGGTLWYKVNGNAAISGTNPISAVAGKSLQTWMQNTSSPGMFCDLGNDPSADCGVQQLTGNCYMNSSTVTLAAYAEPAHTPLNGTGARTNPATPNISIGANGQGVLTLTEQANAKASAMPFGGCLAIEVPSSVSSVTVTGAGVTPGCQYQWTYAISSTSNVYKLFTIPAGWDINGAGDVKTLNIQVQNGAADITSGNLVYTFQPANYYVGNDGNFYLGLEKDKNADTTKTAAAISGGVAIS
jgi:hypothetical protein